MNHKLIPVLIVGAGPAGIGCAVALRTCGVEVKIVDAQSVGGAFQNWPRQMRLLTPSFHSNSFGAVDLNAVTPQTSVADFLHTQHATGMEYARYLLALVFHHGLDVESPVKVTKISPMKEGGFAVATSSGVYHARYVIWAAGEFGSPDDGGIQGASHCIHNSKVGDWEYVAGMGQKFTVIGGYESGLDAAINLVNLGKEVHILSRGQPWGSDDPDPRACN